MSVGDAYVFKNGRELAAWLGIVPKQYSTGGKIRSLGIRKRGDKYLRKIIIHGARSVVRFADKKNDRLNKWVTSLKERRGQNIATVALAKKECEWHGLLFHEMKKNTAPSPSRNRGKQMIFNELRG